MDQLSGDANELDQSAYGEAAQDQIVDEAVQTQGSNHTNGQAASVKVITLMLLKILLTMDNKLN